MMKLNYLWIVYLFLLVLTPLVSAENFTDINYITSVDVTKGINITGEIGSTRVYNSGYWRIEEESGTPGLLFTANVSGVQGNVTNLHVNARYEGGASHDVVLEVFDCETETWFELKTYGNDINFEYDTFDISFIDCVDEGNILFRFHHDATGITSHNFDIDYFVVESEYSETEDTSFSFFDIDLDDTFTIILLVIMILSGIVLSLTYSMFIGGVVLLLTSLFIIFGGYLVLGFILLLFGFLALFNDN